ncbi:MAG: hypothetical protein KGL59_15465 [Acidobacteriota bacterium]|nr:hypothetical protein [Acidobacteriota bacterium]
MGQFLRRVARAVFNRETISQLIVLWFAVWILWWFRRWMGHGPITFPDPTAPGARDYYNVAMRTLIRSLLQSLFISSLALLAWRVLHRHPAGDSGFGQSGSR